MLSTLALALAAVTVNGAAVNLDRPVAVSLTYVVEAPRKVNARSPKRLRVGARSLRLAPGGAPAEFELQPGDAQGGRVTIEAEYYVCEAAPDSPCLRRDVRFELPVDPAAKPEPIVRLATPPFSEK